MQMASIARRASESTQSLLGTWCAAPAGKRRHAPTQPTHPTMELVEMSACTAATGIMKKMARAANAAHTSKERALRSQRRMLCMNVGGRVGG